MNDVENLKHQASGRWSEIVRALSTADIEVALDHPLHHIRCPVHGSTSGQNDGFRTFNDFAESGGTICNTCGPHADGFATLMWLNGWDFNRTLRAVSQYLNGATVKPTTVVTKTAHAHKDPAENERRRAQLNELWMRALPLHAPEANPAWLYLIHRGLDPLVAVTHAQNLRYVSALPYFEGRQKTGIYPALLARITDAAGLPVTLHRTYLTPEGLKAPVSQPKKIMRYPDNLKASGGAIRLFPLSGRELAVCEGIETALAIAETTKLPVWPAYSADMLAAWIPPVGLHRVWIWADRDRKRAGERKARKLLTRLWALGLQARILLPPSRMLGTEKTVDWLDVLVRCGPDQLIALAHKRAASN